MRAPAFLKRLKLPRRPKTLPSRQAYARWAKRYPPRPHNRLMEIEQAAMLRLMPPLAGCEVLDLACGTGRYSLIAQEASARRVVGVDDSLPMLRAGGGGLRIEASMTALPFASASFDVIVCGLAVGHLPLDALRGALAEMARVLRPGGEALISDFHPYLSLMGGRRAFTGDDGRAYAVEQHIHIVSDYFAALRTAGMVVLDIAEPRAELYGRQVPACLVIRCERGRT